MMQQAVHAVSVSVFTVQHGLGQSLSAPSHSRTTTDRPNVRTTAAHSHPH